MSLETITFLKFFFKDLLLFPHGKKNYTKLGKGLVSEGNEAVIPIWPGKNEQRTVFKRCLLKDEFWAFAACKCC